MLCLAWAWHVPVLFEHHCAHVFLIKFWFVYFKTLVMEELLCPKKLWWRLVDPDQFADCWTYRLDFLFFKCARNATLPGRDRRSCLSFYISMGAVWRVQPPVENIQIVFVEVDLDGVDFRVKVAEHHSELFPVVFVWISHSRHEEPIFCLDVWPCALSE